MASGALYLGVTLGALSAGAPIVPTSEPIAAAASESSRLRGSATQGQHYVANRLNSMLARAEDPTFRNQYPAYPSRRAIEIALTLADVLVSEGTPTPSVVPGDGGVVEFVWNKAGWDLMVAIGEENTDLWAHHRATAMTVVHGPLLQQFASFAPILASLSIR